jgi:hypothetical protein
MIAGAVSLWGLGLVTWVFRKIPMKLISKIHGQLTTTLTFDNTELGWARENYASFMEWFMQNKWAKYSRQLALQTYGAQFFDRHNGHGSRNAADVAIGDGNHFFFFKRRLFLMHRRTMEKQGRDNIVYVVTLTMFGRNKAIMQDLVDVFCHKFPENKLKLMRFKSNYWADYAMLDRRELKTVIVEKALKQSLVKAIEDFQMSEAWYTERGLPWKKTFVLHGVPGTGKTSLIKALASHFNLNVCRLNLNALNDEMLEEALANIPSRSILAIEDFDSAKATRRRSAMKSDDSAKYALAVKYDSSGKPNLENTINSIKGLGADDAPVNPMAKLLEDMDGLTLSGILNALDGIASLHGTLIFLTTNTLDDIDPAVIRKGRVDHVFEIKPLTHSEVLDYIELMFPGRSSEPAACFSSILGCDLQALYFEHHDNFDQFIDAIPKVNDLEDTIRQIDTLIKAA